MLNILISLISLSVFSQELKIGLTKKNSLVLRGESCSDLLKQHEAICEWKEQVDGEFEKSIISESLCKKETESQYRVIISSCLPKFVKKYQKRKLYNDGANCWGTALNFKGLTKKPRFVWEKEILYWLDSPICRKLEVGEEKKAGDILAIFGPEYKFNRDIDYSYGDEFWKALYPGRLTEAKVKTGYTGFHKFFHAETYLTEKLSFGKESPNKLDRFQFNPTNEVYARSRDPECQENQSLSPHNRENQLEPKRGLTSSRCRYFSLAYRCENFDSYFKDSELNEEQEILMRELEKLEEKQVELFKLMVQSSFRLNKSQVAEILNFVDTVAERALNELRQKPDTLTEMLLVKQYFNAMGIRKSLEYAEYTEATELL